ncbi:MAG: tRNA pseudouridine(55) synthase TruB [Acidimicrobiia bacterium]
MPVDGLVVVDKAAAWTSHDVVAKLRGVYRQRRIGHAGTLDPDATGVLLVGLGRATRLLRFLMETDKAYRGVVVFGVATDTLDAAGTVLERVAVDVTERDVRAATRRFVGRIEQVPPMVSAVKVGGRRLYELAREGRQVERAPRRVEVTRFDVESFVPGAYPRAAVCVECSSGTYIRTLAADLGAALGVPAHLAELRRVRSGSFTVDDARTVEAIVADPAAAVLTPAGAMRALEQISVDHDVARAAAHGVVFPLPAFGGADLGPGPFALVDPDGALVAVYERRGAGIKPAVVISSAGEGS